MVATYRSSRFAMIYHFRCTWKNQSLTQWELSRRWKRRQWTVSIALKLSNIAGVKHIFLDERFEYARKLKLCMSALRSSGERMGRYALAKRQAVVQEDFITAKLRKEQIEMYKNAVFAHLRVETLMERDKVCIQCTSDPSPTLTNNSNFRWIQKMTRFRKFTPKSRPFQHHPVYRMFRPH